jgi:hypothetical protein
MTRASQATARRGDPVFVRQAGRLQPLPVERLASVVDVARAKGTTPWRDLSLIDERNEQPLRAAFVAAIAAWGVVF